MTTLSRKTTLVTGASRGMGVPVCLHRLRQAPKFSCTAVVASKKPTASSPRYASTGQRSKLSSNICNFILERIRSFLGVHLFPRLMHFSLHVVGRKHTTHMTVWKI
jgi:hypothetical protein